MLKTLLSISRSDKNIEDIIEITKFSVAITLLKFGI